MFQIKTPKFYVITIVTFISNIYPIGFGALLMYKTGNEYMAPFGEGGVLNTVVYICQFNRQCNDLGVCLWY